jgi:hypothetical protein
MRNPLTAMVVCLLLGPAYVQAQETIIDAHAMFYFRVAFDGGSASEREPTFGFRMDQVAYQSHRPLQYRSLLQRPAMLGLSMNRHGLQSFQLSGTDYLQRYRVHHAGEDDTGAGAEEQATTGEAGEEEPPQAPKMMRDVGDTVTYLVEEAPGGFIIGAVIGVVLLAGVGG